MANVLDELIADQNARGLRPASLTQLGTGQAGLAPTTPQITIAPASPLLPFGEGFSQTNWNQNPAQLRQQLNLEELQTRAAANKFALERAQLTAPLQDRLLQAQIDASGGHDRFLREQDAATLGHTAGFFNDLLHPNAPRPQDVGYHDYVLTALAKNPRFAETAGGKDFLKRLADTQATHVSMADLQAKYGDTLSSVTIGKNGQPSVTLKPNEPDAALEKAAKGYGLSLDQIRNPIGAEVGKKGKDGAFVGDEAGDIVRVDGPEGKKVSMSVKEYLRLGGQFSPEGAAKQGIVPAIDMTALAQKALNSPNATEAEKAAARKRLGL